MPAHAVRIDYSDSVGLPAWEYTERIQSRAYIGGKDREYINDMYIDRYGDQSATIARYLSLIVYVCMYVHTRTRIKPFRYKVNLRNLCESVHRSYRALFSVFSKTRSTRVCTCDRITRRHLRLEGFYQERVKVPT